MSEILFRALKKNPKAYVNGYDGKDQTNKRWVYGRGVIPVYENTYPTRKMEMVISVNYDELDYWQPGYLTCEIIPETACRYTGLHDCAKWGQLSREEQKDFLSEWNFENNRKNRKEDWNGRKIFEGDIVKVSHTDGQEEYVETTEVSYVGKTASFSPWNWEYECDGCDLRCEIKEIEVIGNIFDNPELIGSD